MKLSPWTMLFIAGLTEIVWAIAMDYSDGFTKIEYDIIVIVFLIIGMIFLTKALNGGLPIGTAYSVWVGIGAVGTMTASIALGLEEIVPLRLLFVAMIIIGILGLKYTSEKEN